MLVIPEDQKSPKENIKTSPLERQQTLGGFSLCCIQTTSMKIVVDNLSDCGILCIELIVTQQKSSLTICIHIFFMMGICVVVAQQTLTLLVQVRFLYPLPNGDIAQR